MHNILRRWGTDYVSELDNGLHDGYLPFFLIIMHALVHIYNGIITSRSKEVQRISEVESS